MNALLRDQEQKRQVDAVGYFLPSETRYPAPKCRPCAPEKQNGLAVPVGPPGGRPLDVQLHFVHLFHRDIS